MFTRRGFLRATSLGVGASLSPIAGLAQDQTPPHHSPIPVTGPVIAIVLAGGGAKGSFEVGAVRYLYDQGIRPNILCGTSVGAINAAKLAEGQVSSGNGNLRTLVRREIDKE
jgi:predicted acylesterase/phospholipase RssA